MAEIATKGQYVLGTDLAHEYAAYNSASDTTNF